MKFAAIQDRAEPVAEQPLVVTDQPATMLAYLKAANSGADLERLEKLMDLHERWERNEARKAFENAMADFRSETMVILKSKYVDIAGGAKFWHAQLYDVCNAVVEKLSKYGLRHRWLLEQPPGKVRVTCIISHRAGHSESTSMESPPDTAGNKSAIHAIASAETLLERYTLLAAVGLAAKDMDNNPQGTGVPDPDVKAPSDYQRWKADTRALADEGKEQLLAHWQKSPNDIRQWAVSRDKAWWEDTKAIAVKVSKKAQAAKS